MVPWLLSEQDESQEISITPIWVCVEQGKLRHGPPSLPSLRHQSSPVSGAASENWIILAPHVSQPSPDLFLWNYIPGGGEDSAWLPHEAVQQSSPLGQGFAGCSWREPRWRPQTACLSAAGQTPPPALPALGSWRTHDCPGSHHPRKSPLFWHPGSHSQP